MKDTYDLAEARRQNAVRYRAYELHCNVIVAAYEQERDAKKSEERRKAKQAALALVAFSLVGSE